MNPAANYRAKAQAIWPGAIVTSRSIKNIIHRHPTDPTRFIEDADLGQIHYGPQADQEIETAWVPTSAPEDSPHIRKMDLAPYKALFGNGNLQFDAAFPFRYINPSTGDFLAWQANPNLQWTNNLNSVANIGLTKQAVTAQIDDDELFFPGVYGAGFDFYLELQTSRLQKRLEILSAATLGTPPQSIIDGGNPVAMLSFQFQRSAGVQIWVDGARWGEATGQGNAVATVNTVEFRNSQGTVLWAMPSAWAADANGDTPGGVVTRFRRAGPSYFIEFRVPWDWLQTAAYPVVIDPTVDTQVAAGADDAFENDDNSGFDGTGGNLRMSSNTSATIRQNGGTRFILTGPASGDTIDVAYCPIHAVSTATDDPNCDIHCEDVDNAQNYTDNADVTSRVRTTAFTTWTATAIGAGEVNSPSIVSAVQEVIDRAGWASGNALNVLWDGKDNANFTFRIDSFEISTTDCAKLHIEYTAGGGLSATVNQVVETDLAQALARLKARAVAQITETDLSQPVGRIKTIQAAMISETDAAQAIGVLKAIAVAQVTETDLAQAITEDAAIIQPVAQITETDLAQAIARSKLMAVGQTAETDVAQALARAKQRALGQTTETDLAQAFARSKLLSVSLTSETDAAQALTTAKRQALGQTTETDLAQALAHLKRLALAQVSETDLSQALIRPIIRLLSQATETDLSQNIIPPLIRLLAQTVETDLAQSITTSGAVLLGQVDETDLAQALTRLKRLALGQVSESDLAQAFARAKALGVGQVTESDLAHPFTVRRAYTVMQVSETDLAQALFPHKRILVVQAVETDLAQAIIAPQTVVLAFALETDQAFEIVPPVAYKGVVGEVLYSEELITLQSELLETLYSELITILTS